MNKIKTAEQILNEANFICKEEEMEAILSFMETYADQFKGKTTVLANRICEVCKCYPSVIIITEFGTFCNAHAKYVR